MDIEQLKYPIGKFKRPDIITPAHINEWIEDIEIFPGMLRKTVHGMTEAELATPYREGGWTVRQVVHHLPDSHMNAYTRFKLTITEDRPKIKPYLENEWAELEDGRIAPVDFSLNLLDSLHKRWVMLLKSMSASDFKRTFIHPEQGKEFSLDGVVGLYAWHGRHHLAHIQKLKERMKW